MAINFRDGEFGGTVTLDVNPGAYKTTAEAAEAVHEAVRKLSASFGQNPDREVFIQTPEQCAANGYGKNWRVCWESGPFEWAIAASFEITGPWGYTEPYHSFDLCFTS